MFPPLETSSHGPVPDVLVHPWCSFQALVPSIKDFQSLELSSKSK